MRVAIEALGIHYAGGGRSATLNLMESLFQIDPVNEYLVILTAPEPSLAVFGNVRQLIAPVRNRLLARIWASLRLPRILRSYDLVHFVKNLSIFGTHIPQIVTIYDLTTLLFPQLFPRIDVAYWRWIQPLTLRRADVIVAISQQTAQDIRRLYQVPEDKIRLIYPGYANVFRPPTPAMKTHVRQKYNLPDQFVLQVGRLDRKKNLPTLVRAFALLKRDFHFAGKLVLVGEEYAKMRDPDLKAAIEETQLQSDLIMTGAVPLEDLPALYGSATVAVFLSWHEGFGLVGLEAMACGAPLIASRSGAIPEAVGDAAVLVDVRIEPKQLASELWRIVSSPEIRTQMQAAGFKQAARFSNEQCAYDTLAVYQEAVGQARSRAADC